jgi:uncharacterized membrane protein YcaP (DUF421 family)
MDAGAGNLWTFNGGVWWHFILRAAVVYFMVLVFIRGSGKRQVGQMTPFDLVLLLLISNAVQNAMNGGDNSITAGFILAGTLIAVDLGIGWITRRSRKLEKIVEGEAEILIHNGQLIPGALERAGLTQHELLAALRESDCAAIKEVHTAILETNGRITVLTRKDGRGEER